MTDQPRNSAISRRRLLGTGAAASAGACSALPPRRSPAARSRATSADAGRRRDRRRRVRRPDRGPRAERKGHSAIVLEARDRVGGRALNADIGGGEITERGATFVGPTQDHVIALGREDEGRPLQHLRHRREPVHRERVAAAVQRHRRDRLGPARPDDPPRPDPVRHPARRDVQGGPGRRSLDGAEGGRVRRADAAAVRRRRTRSRRSSRTWRRSRRGRSSAPSRARSRCCSSSSTSPRRATSRTSAPSSATSTPATAPRCTGSSAARSVICKRIARKLGRSVVLESPVRRIVQERRGVTVHSDRMDVRAKRVIVAVPPVLTGQDRLRARPARRARRADRPLPAGQPDQGGVRVRPPVLARRRAHRPGAVRRTGRSRPASTIRPRTAARASCSGSSAATRRARSRS